ncbi:MAG TPA: GNAT family N-acetyltransferase [Candidatus Tectomicrobia bacterium]|nr:GNAT family N-acetyltransferase [Candidatus Tectomicrobia bacterium]
MIAIRPMTVDDIPQVERIIDAETAARRRDTGEAELEQLDSRLVKTRFHKEPTGCFVAEDPTHGSIGTVLSIAWGSLAWLGPLAVHPEFSGQGVEPQLLRAVLDYWEPMTLSAQGAETDPANPSQVELYASFGFRPQFLTATLVGAVDPDGPREPIRQRTPSFELRRLSELSDTLKETMLSNCRRISERHYPGLDYSKELQSVKDLQLGDTLLLAVGERLYGFAICHAASGSEADPDSCYVKALLIDPAIDDQETLLALVEACEGYARTQTLKTVRLGVNLACWEGYLAVATRGYRIRQLRLRMVRPIDELLSDLSPFHFNDWR